MFDFGIFFGGGGGGGGVGKYWLVFWGEFDFSRGFWDIQNYLKIHDSCIIQCFLEIFMAWKFTQVWSTTICKLFADSTSSKYFFFQIENRM